MRRVGLFTVTTLAAVAGLVGPVPALALDPEALDAEIAASAGTRFAAEIEEVKCPFDLSRGDSAACFAAAVPKYYEDVRDDGTLPEEAPRLDLAVILLENFIVDDDPNPVVFIAGGPGQAPSMFLDDYEQALELRRTRGLVLVDQRGTGNSEPRLDCEDTSPEELDSHRLNNPDLAPELTVQDRLEACARTYQAQGIDFQAFGTRSAALDLMAIRQGFGLDRWNLHGTSYGARVALDSMRVDPEGVRSVILNSVQGVQPHFDEAFYGNRAAIFERLFENCAADEACNTHFGDLRAHLGRIKDHLEEEGLTLFLRNPATGELVRETITWPDVINGLYAHMNFTPNAEPVARYIYQISRVIDGRLSLNDDEVVRIFQHSLFGDDFGLAIGQHMAVRCREDFPALDEQAALAVMQTRDFFYPDEDIGEIYQTCPIWAAGEPDEDFAALVESDIPALILAGDVDPLTPIEWARDTHLSLLNSQLVEFRGMGHDIYGTMGCARILTANFLDAPFDPLDTTCADLSEPIFEIAQD